MFRRSWEVNSTGSKKIFIPYGVDGRALPKGFLVQQDFRVGRADFERLRADGAELQQVCGGLQPQFRRAVFEEFG